MATGAPAGLFAVSAIAVLAALGGLASRSPRAGAVSRGRAGAHRRGAGLGGTGRFGAAQVTLGAAGVTAWSLINLILPQRENGGAIAVFTATTVLGVGVLLAAGAESLWQLSLVSLGCLLIVVALLVTVEAAQLSALWARFPLPVIPAPGDPDPVSAVAARAGGPAATGTDQRRAPNRFHRRGCAPQRARVGGNRMAPANPVRLGLVCGRRDLGGGCPARPGMGLVRHAKPGCWPSRYLVSVALAVFYTATAHYLAALVAV